MQVLNIIELTPMTFSKDYSLPYTCGPMNIVCQFCSVIFHEGINQMINS